MSDVDDFVVHGKLCAFYLLRGFFLSRTNDMDANSGGDDNQSTAQVLASGTQDIAALAGLFCTDGVVRRGTDTAFATY